MSTFKELLVNMSTGDPHALSDGDWRAEEAAIEEVRSEYIARLSPATMKLVLVALEKGSKETWRVGVMGDNRETPTPNAELCIKALTALNTPTHHER